MDTDGDGIPDHVEKAGWRSVDGVVYVTDPKSDDTDGDGLTDAEEAGELVDAEEFIYAVVTDPTRSDSDDDGLDDRAETLGWKTKAGDSFSTDPMNPDSDGDGLPDGIEAGPLLRKNATEIVFLGFSNPLMIDSDGDELSDLDEADEGTDPFLIDTDADGLNDFQELRLFGTDPASKDTDGDGIDDLYEVQNSESQGLSPVFADEKVDTLKYATDFATGAFLGDAKQIDSLAWFLGGLFVGLIGFIPLLGQVVGTTSDLRDLIVNLIKRDWVSAGFNAGGLIPYTGDTASIVRKVKAFIEKNPHLKRVVNTAIANLKQLPEKVRIEVLKATDPSFGELTRKKASDAAVLKMQQNGMDLTGLVAAMKRKGHTVGIPIGPYKDWRSAEIVLELDLAKRNRNVSTQASRPTDGCLKVCKEFGRKFDVLADGVAHEAKVGYVSLTDNIRKQIQADAHFVETGEIKRAQWHFYQSETTGLIGPSRQVLDLMDELGIKYTIHLPAN